MDKYRILDLFSGIGGFSLGLEATGGFEAAAFCEIEEYPRKVLNKHWPNVPIYEDVRNVTAERLRSDGIGRIDVVTGGFPCQDISVAGKQKGIGAERSGLWSECARLLGEIRPSYAIFENVSALLSGDGGRWFQRVLFDISEIGYDVEWHCISASEIGANHHRDRVWIICYPKHDGRTSSKIREGNKAGNGGDSQRSGPASEFEGPSNAEDVGNASILQRDGCIDNSENCKCKISESRDTNCANNVPNTKSEQGRRIFEPELQPNSGASGEQDVAYSESLYAQGFMYRQRKGESWRSSWWEIEPNVGRVANGIPGRVDRLKGLGNAVVPQIPELIGRAILEAES